MKRTFFIAGVIGTISAGAALLGPAKTAAHKLPNEANAANMDWPVWQCASPVVWLNTASGKYHYQSDHWYGHTKRGAYACEKQAVAAGYRASVK